MTRPLAERFHALVVGVDDYQSKLYRPLRGAVADAEAVRDYLVDGLGIACSRVELLTAPRSRDSVASATVRPTYEAVHQALGRLGSEGESGDQVLFYFSGHGGRAPTSIPKVRGKDGLDKFLATAGMESPEGRPLRDVELAYQLDQLASRGMRITVVLDCCHSGGSLRSPNVSWIDRRGGVLDRTPRQPGDFASPEELAACWRQLKATSRDAEVGSGWRLPAGAVVAAACRADEFAYEDRLGGARRGVFTYWWLDSLSRWGLGQSYRRIHDRVLAKVQIANDDQTPILEGDHLRLVFGDSRRVSLRGVVILEVRRGFKQVVLDAGRAHGLHEGTVLSLELASSVTTSPPVAGASKPLLLSVTDDLDSTYAVADLIDPVHVWPEPGDRAVIIDLGQAHLRCRIAIEAQSVASLGLCPEEIAGGIEASGFLQLTDSEAELKVIGLEGTVFIVSVTGSPLLKLESVPSVVELVSALEHLAKYLNIQRLENPDSQSKLRDHVTLTLRRPPVGWQYGDPIRPQLGAKLPSPVRLDHGEVIWIVVENRSPLTINYAIFDLRPDWECARLLPADTDSRQLAAERSEGFALRPCYVEGIRPCRDVMKLIASSESTDFSWLQLPLPSQPDPAVMRDLGPGADPLQRLLAALRKGVSSMRSVAPRRATSWLFWTTDAAVFEVMPHDGDE